MLTAAQTWGFRYVTAVAAELPAAPFKAILLPSAAPTSPPTAPILQGASRIHPRALLSAESELAHWRDTEAQKGLLVLLASELCIFGLGLSAYAIKRRIEPQPYDSRRRSDR